MTAFAMTAREMITVRNIGQMMEVLVVVVMMRVAGLVRMIGELDEWVVGFNWMSFPRWPE